MTWPRLLALACAAAAPVVAQQAPGLQAAEAYASAAELYIDGEAEAAEAAAVDGLAAAPDDAKLQALLDLIRQQQPPQDGGGGESEEGETNPNESDQENAQDGQSGQQARPEDGSPPAEQDQTRADAGDEPRDASEEPPSDGTSEGTEPGDSGEAPPQEVPAGQMSAEQAGRILDAVGGEERLLMRELRRQRAPVRRTDKDW